MKITICGSMNFAKEMIDAKNKLETAGHEVTIPHGTEKYIDDNFTVENKWEKIEGDVIRNYFEKIKASDAILILNLTKNGVENYVGGNALIEMAFAHVLNKKIFLLNPIPTKMNYSDEIEAMMPIVLNGDLAAIK